MEQIDTMDREYRLDEQVGFLMRRANQRHLGLFAGHIPDLTPMQFAALAKLCELGGTSQNALGRATAMDAATIKGVIDRLRRKGFVTTDRDPKDLRRIRHSVTMHGRAAFNDLSAKARRVTAETLEPLDAVEKHEILRLLAKLG